MIVAAWLAYPLVMLALALGCGLLLEAVARVRLGMLLLPAGFAVAIAVGAIPVAFGSGGPWAAPLVVACAVAGLVSRGWWRRGREHGVAALAALGVYVVYALPIVASGSATFAGYIKLDDTATFLGLGDRIVEHGHSVALPPSSYEAMLSFNLGHGYPIGSLLPFALGSRLTGIDSAWIWQPTLALTAALLALCLYALAVRLVPTAALVAFVGAQPALLYGYGLWGGVKELTAALLVALAVALAERGALVPLAVAGAALLDALSVGGLLWLFPIAVFVTVAQRRRATLVAAGGVLVALALPALVNARSFLSGDTVTTLQNGKDLGNLIRPLSLLQLAGVWPVGDFRLHPSHRLVTALLVVLVVAAAAGCLYVAWQRRDLGLPLLLAVALVGAAVYAGFGSPWVAGKAYATAAPALLAVGAAGALCLPPRLGLPVFLVIAAGVLWSNALAYRDVALAPRGRLAELETIGRRFGGDGPALMTEYNPYGVRHFLRRLDPEGASELRRREVFLARGGTLQKGQSADVGVFALSSLEVYRTLVLRRSPVAPRPPSDFTLVWSGRYYEVWERAPGARVLEHVEAPTCADVRRLAQHGPLIAAPSAPTPILFNLGAAPQPPGWTGFEENTEAVVPTDHGAVASFMTIPATARYSVWIGGSFGGDVDVYVDGRRIVGGHNRPDWPGLWAPLGTASITAGRHAVIVRYRARSWTPGARGEPPLLGPLALERETARAPLVYGSAAQLCGRRLDWVEALARS